MHAVTPIEEKLQCTVDYTNLQLYLPTFFLFS